MSWWSYRPYVPAAERRAKAIRKMGKLAKKGQKFSPVKIIGRKIATTFWARLGATIWNRTAILVTGCLAAEHTFATDRCWTCRSKPEE